MTCDNCGELVRQCVDFNSVKLCVVCFNAEIVRKVLQR